MSHATGVFGKHRPTKPSFPWNLGYAGWRYMILLKGSVLITKLQRELPSVAATVLSHDRWRQHSLQSTPQSALWHLQCSWMRTRQLLGWWSLCPHCSRRTHCFGSTWKSRKNPTTRFQQSHVLDVDLNAIHPHTMPEQPWKPKTQSGKSIFILWHLIQTTEEKLQHTTNKEQPSLREIACDLGPVVPGLELEGQNLCILCRMPRIKKTWKTRDGKKGDGCVVIQYTVAVIIATL